MNLLDFMEVDVKIKRYMAASMRAALAQVRAEQGPDAVILSSRRVDEGIEVIAAVDYDEALFADRRATLAASAAASASAGDQRRLRATARPRPTAPARTGFARSTTRAIAAARAAHAGAHRRRIAARPRARAAAHRTRAAAIWPSSPRRDARSAGFGTRCSGS